MGPLLHSVCVDSFGTRKIAGRALKVESSHENMLSPEQGQKSQQACMILESKERYSRMSWNCLIRRR